MRFAHLPLVCALAIPACLISPALARAGFTTLTFDDLPAGGYIEGTPIPAAAQLSDQLVGTYVR